MKSDFKEGDEVVIHFDGQDYSGVVKESEYLITTRSQSPSLSSEPLVEKSEESEVAKSRDLPTNPSAGKKRTVQTTPKKRRCGARKKPGKCTSL